MVLVVVLIVLPGFVPYAQLVVHLVVLLLAPLHLALEPHLAQQA